MPISKLQTAAAVDLIRTIRPAWDANNTARAIAELTERYPLPDIVAAAIKAASNPDNRTPLAIGWELDKAIAASSPVSGPPGKYAHEPRCAICGLRFTRCRYMCSKTSDRHVFSETD